jgi:hypothetical protein
MGEARKTAPKNELYDAQRPGYGLSVCWASEHARALQEPKPRLREFESGQCLARTARMMEAKRFAKKISAAER